MMHNDAFEPMNENVGRYEDLRAFELAAARAAYEAARGPAPVPEPLPEPVPEAVPEPLPEPLPARKSPSRKEQSNKYFSRQKTRKVIESGDKKKANLQKHGLISVEKLLDYKIPVQPLTILSYEKTMPPATFEFAKTLEVDVYFENEWFKMFRNLNEKWFSSDSFSSEKYSYFYLSLNKNQAYKNKLKALIDSLSYNKNKPEYYLSKLSEYNSIRALYNNADYMPKIVIVAAVPESVKATKPGQCNIYTALESYSAKLAKQDSVSTNEVLKCLPATDTLGTYFKGRVDSLPKEFKQALVENTALALKTHPALQETLSLTPDEIESEHSTVLCSNCGITVSNINWYLENLVPSLNETGFASLKNLATLADVAEIVEFKCNGNYKNPCEKMISWKKLVTLFYQSLSEKGTKATATDKKYIQVLEDKYTKQSLLNQYPNNYKTCKTENCLGQNGMFILNRNNFHKLNCVYCVSAICSICDLQGENYHYDQNCPGYLATHMDQETIDSLLALGMKMCPGCHQGCLKTQYCDHITCPTPGCGTHFCYRCGIAFAHGTYSHSSCRERVPGILELEERQRQQDQQRQRQQDQERQQQQPLEPLEPLEPQNPLETQHPLERLLLLLLVLLAFLLEI